MNTPTNRETAVEMRLRQTVPPLREPDLSRVSAACVRAASSSSASPLREPRTFIRPLLRVAASFALLLGVAVLMRPKHPAAERLARPAVPPSLPAVATFRDLADLMQRQDLANSLASEADNLSADLTDLTARLNERTLSILF